ncbi:MAG TPA: DUF3667 domain-containing protein [Chthoniobacterales bacterium]
MSDETSDAILGDAVAASLERPDRKRRGLFRWRRPKDPRRFTHCEDCGTELHGRYCSKCGQVAVDYHRSFRHVIADVAESFLNWDSKFIKTIGLLFVSPGWLTNQFVAGRRTRYLHPLRLYLLVSIVFFLCVRFVSFEPKHAAPRNMTAKDRAEIQEAMSNPAIPAAVRQQVLANLPDKAKSLPVVPGVPAASSVTPGPNPSPTPSLQSELDKSKAPGWLKERILAKVGPHGDNVKLLGKTLRDNISTMMLFCIPLFALVLKVLYFRQHRFYIEHLVYALHIHAFFYVAVLTIAFSGMAAKLTVPSLEGLLLFLLVLGTVAQVFRSIRQVYGQSWPMTTFKFFFGGFIYVFVLLLALVVTAVATVAFS